MHYGSGLLCNIFWCVNLLRTQSSKERVNCFRTVVLHFANSRISWPSNSLQATGWETLVLHIRNKQLKSLRISLKVTRYTHMTSPSSTYNKWQEELKKLREIKLSWRDFPTCSVIQDAICSQTLWIVTKLGWAYDNVFWELSMFL